MKKLKRSAALGALCILALTAALVLHAQARCAPGLSLQVDQTLCQASSDAFFVYFVH